MNNQLRNFQKAYKKLSESLNIEVNEDHSFFEVMHELEGVAEVLDEQNRTNRMEKMRREKAAYYRKQSDVWRSKTEGDQQVAEKRQRDLKRKEKELLEMFKEEYKDLHNAEVRYRKGFFLKGKGEFSRAIQQFQKALEINERPNCTFSLTKAQVLKAHMYIGHCAGNLLNSSLAKAYELNVEEVIDKDRLQTEGRSFDEVLEMLQHVSEHYKAIHNGKKRILSLEEYLHFKAGGFGETILVSFVESRPFVKVGEGEPNFVPEESVQLFRYQIDKIVEKGYVSFDDISGDFGSDKSWDTHRKYMSRMNELTNDKNSKIFEITPGTFSERYPKKIQFTNNDLIIVFRQNDFYEGDFDI